MSNLENGIRIGKTPWGLGWSLAAGFVAWGFDLALSYALEQHSCSTGHHYVLHVITIVCMAIALSGFAMGLMEFKRFPRETSEEGGNRIDRAYFQSMLGMAFCLVFAIVIIAGSVPRWILSPCE
jgi:hypothetical protein